MLGAQIDVVEAPIWNFKAYLLPLPDQKKTMTAVALNKTKRADWTEMIVKNARVCSAHLSEKEKKYFCCCFVVWRFLASHVYEMSVCMCVKQQTDNWYAI